MAVYETPVNHEDHYIQQDTPGSSAGIWAVTIVIIALLGLIFFGVLLMNKSTPTNNGINVTPPSVNNGGTGNASSY